MLKPVLWLFVSLGVGGALAVEGSHHFFGGDPWHKHDPGYHPVAAPEIDPAGAASALTLLAGGLTVLRGRRARK